MAEENNAPLAGGGEATTAPVAQQPQSIEDKLGSFDFDASSQQAPVAAEPKEQVEPGDDDAISELAGEESGDTAKPASDDDSETTLRDGSKVKIAELKRGYRPDWEKQVAEFTEKQKAFEQNTQGFTQREQQYAQLLHQAAMVVSANMPKEPDKGLVETDPFEYQRQDVLYRTKLGELQQIQQAQAQFAQQVAQRQEHEQREHIARERDATLAALPHLRDPVRAQKFYQDVKELAVEMGYSTADLAGIHDHRLMKVLNLALEGKQLKASLEKAKAKLKEARQAKPVPEVQEPSRRRSPAETRNEKMREQLARLRKTGRPEHADAVLSQYD